MAGPLQIAYEGPDGRIVVTDSLTYSDARITTADIVVGGSFAGEYPVAFALRCGAKGVIGNAAGVGKDDSGIAGLAVADRYDVPCVAVSELSARLADGPDVYQNGVVSHANRAAEALGVRVGLPCVETAQHLLAAQPGEIGRASELVNAEREIVWQGPEGSVAAMASVGLANANNTGQVICAGSHLGLVTWRYVTGYAFPVAGVICSDCGVGKDDSGIAGLEPLAEAGLPAAAVSHRTARIGEGRSTYADGVVSHANRVARQAGIRPGQSAREAAALMLRLRAKKSGES